MIIQRLAEELSSYELRLDEIQLTGKEDIENRMWLNRKHVSTVREEIKQL